MLRTFGKFELIRPLGRGAMGEVYLARDPAIGREIAIKTIRREALLSPQARERFAREARAAGTLNHPNVVTIHEFGEVEETMYLAMEWVEGEDLSGLLRDRLLAPDEILEVMAQVCDGLAYAHAKGILHRDIKPSNIRVSRQHGQVRAKIMDFGIAHLSGSDMTGTGTLLGTFSYMAPEYVQTGVPSAASDLFAVGVVLYEAFSGRRLFDADSTATVLFKVVNEVPRPLDPGCFRGISPRTQAVIRKALAKQPSLRFQDAAHLAAALRAARDPAWAGLEGGWTEAATARSARAPQAPEPRSGTATRPMAVAGAPTGGAGPLPWGWLTAAGVALLSLGLWFGSRREAAPTAASQPSPAAPAPAARPVAAPPASTPPSDASPGPVAGSAAPVAVPAGTEGPAPLRIQPPPDRSEAAREPAPDAFEDLPPEADPERQLERAQRALDRRPDLPRAHARKLVALYRLGRYRDMADAFRDAAGAGVLEPQLRRDPRFAAMEAEEMGARRIPAEDRIGLPPPLGDRPPERR